MALKVVQVIVNIIQPMVAAPIHAMIWKTAWLEENNLSSKKCSVDKPKRKRNKAAEAAEGSKILGGEC